MRIRRCELRAEVPGHALQIASSASAGPPLDSESNIYTDKHRTMHFHRASVPAWYVVEVDVVTTNSTQQGIIYESRNAVCGAPVFRRYVIVDSMVTSLRKLSATGSLAFALTSLAGGVARAADPNPYDTQLEIDVTPYIWVPGINASIRHSLGSIVDASTGHPIGAAEATYDATIGPNQILANFNFALMGAVSVHYGTLALYGDFINLNVSGSGLTKVRNVGNTAYTLGATAGGQIVPTIFTVAPGLRVLHNKFASADIIAGVQTMWLSTNSTASVTGPLGNTFSGGSSQFQSVTSFVAGTTGRLHLIGKLSLPFFFDYGFGQPSSLQWLAGLKYGDRSGISLNWRTIQFNTTNTSSMVQNLNLSGLLLGYTLSI